MRAGSAPCGACRRPIIFAACRTPGACPGATPASSRRAEDVSRTLQPIQIGQLRAAPTTGQGDRQLATFLPLPLVAERDGLWAASVGPTVARGTARGFCCSRGSAACSQRGDARAAEHIVSPSPPAGVAASRSSRSPNLSTSSPLSRYVEVELAGGKTPRPRRGGASRHPCPRRAEAFAVERQQLHVSGRSAAARRVRSRRTAQHQRVPREDAPSRPHDRLVGRQAGGEWRVRLAPRHRTSAIMP